MPNLDERLDAARADLLRQIKAPELSDIRHRARAIRRRRHMVAAGAALACVIAAGAGVVALGGSADRNPPPIATSADPRPVYRGGGLTLLGIAGGAENRDVLKLPGLTQDVEFANTERGYALSADCDAGGSPCRLSLATTDDAGLTWRQLAAPVPELPQVPDLITIGDDGVLLRDGRSAWFSIDNGLNWGSVESPVDPQLVGTPAEGAALVLGGADVTGEKCVARPVDAWQPGGLLRRLAKQPKLDVCWIGSARTADGSWWVGGTTLGGGAPTVAVKRGDADWGHFLLPAVPEAPGAWAEVSTVGGEAYAIVVSASSDNKELLSRTVHAIYKLSLGGSEFQPYGDGSRLGVIAGDLVPLLDGRLTAASKESWMVSMPDGTGFDLAEGQMPSVLRIQRTGPYWAAFDLFRGGWVAISTDGATWRKIFVV
jgi:hypothetical protein